MNGLIRRLSELRQRYGLRRGLLREFRLQQRRVLHRHDQRSLAADLSRLGVRDGDIVFTHSALSAFGHVVGGADAVIRALIECVGARGTILMPSFSSGGLALDYVRRNPVFDVRHTPSDLGAIPELFRQRHATHRSLHPTHSVCGYGPHAEELLEGHEKAPAPFGPGTPFVKCAERGGRGLIIGARVHNYTTLRAIEDIREDYPLPVYCPERYTLEVIDWAGRRFAVTTKVHNPELGPYRNGDLLIPHLRNYGVLREGSVGQAAAYLIEGQNLIAILGELVDRGVLPFTISPAEFRQRHVGEGT